MSEAERLRAALLMIRATIGERYGMHDTIVLIDQIAAEALGAGNHPTVDTRARDAACRGVA